MSNLFSILSIAFLGYWLVMLIRYYMKPFKGGVGTDNHSFFLRNILSLLAFLVIFLLIGYAIGYIYGSVTMQAYRGVERSMIVFLMSSGCLFVVGFLYRIVFNKLSSACGVLCLLTLIIAMCLTGFHAAVGSVGRTLNFLF